MTTFSNSGTSIFRLPCGHEVDWVGFDVFDVIHGRVPCRVCLILEIQRRHTTREETS